MKRGKGHAIFRENQTNDIDVLSCREPIQPLCINPLNCRRLSSLLEGVTSRIEGWLADAGDRWPDGVDRRRLAELVVAVIEGAAVLSPAVGGDGSDRRLEGVVSVVDENRVRRLVARVVDEVLAGADEVGDDAVAVGCDHGGFRLKELLVKRLEAAGRVVRDCGTTSAESVDYPDFAHAVAQLVSSGACSAGIIVDGAGIGSAMVANKVPGVRAALCYDLSSARNSREHNHANVLTLGAGLIGDGLACQIVDEWLATDWGGGRHAARVDKITAVEALYAARRPAGGES